MKHDHGYITHSHYCRSTNSQEMLQWVFGHVSAQWDQFEMTHWKLYSVYADYGYILLCYLYLIKCIVMSNDIL